MKIIQLTKGMVAIVDDQDYQRLSHFKWYALSSRGTFYAAHQNHHSAILMHRLVLYVPRGIGVDHINGDTLDNRRANLRPATQSQNGFNRRINRFSTSGFKGVHFYKRTSTWNAQITFQGKRYNLGYFNSPEAAASEYNKAAKLIFRQFARLNLPKSGFISHSVIAGDRPHSVVQPPRGVGRSFV